MGNPLLKGKEKRKRKTKTKEQKKDIKKKKVFFIIYFIYLEIEKGGKGRAPGSAALC